MTQRIRVIHYLNQFFAGLGGEEQSNHGAVCFDGPRGPGQLLLRLAQEQSLDVEIVATIAAGDNFVAEQIEPSIDQIVGLVHTKLTTGGADVVLAGPAFNAGRYGMACAALCERIEKEFKIPALTALYDENPAVDTYRRKISIVRAGSDVMDMAPALSRMLRAARKRVAGEPLTTIEDELIPAGIRQNFFAAECGAQRAINILQARIAKLDFETEYPMPVFDRVAPAPAIRSARSSTIALLTSGGIVPRGNPDGIEAANASGYAKYSLEGLDRLDADDFQSVHGGYDPTYANSDPNRVLPLDTARAFEREGRIGRLHAHFYTTVGNATSVDRAKRYGEEIAAILVNEGVQAVVFTST